jgi:hypothetical protein
MPEILLRKPSKEPAIVSNRMSAGPTLLLLSRTGATETAASVPGLLSDPSRPLRASEEPAAQRTVAPAIPQSFRDAPRGCAASKEPAQNGIGVEYFWAPSRIARPIPLRY